MTQAALQLDVQAVLLRSERLTVEISQAGSLYQWEIMLCSKAVGVREYDDFTPSRAGIWGDAHVISAETFIDISLQPGEVKAWQRKYEFFA